MYRQGFFSRFIVLFGVLIINNIALADPHATDSGVNASGFVVGGGAFGGRHTSPIGANEKGAFARVGYQVENPDSHFDGSGFNLTAPALYRHGVRLLLSGDLHHQFTIPGWHGIGFGARVHGGLQYDHNLPGGWVALDNYGYAGPGFCSDDEYHLCMYGGVGVGANARGEFSLLRDGTSPLDIMGIFGVGAQMQKRLGDNAALGLRGEIITPFTEDVVAAVPGKPDEYRAVNAPKQGASGTLRGSILLPNQMVEFYLEGAINDRLQGIEDGRGLKAVPITVLGGAQYLPFRNYQRDEDEKRMKMQELREEYERDRARYYQHLDQEGE